MHGRVRIHADAGLPVLIALVWDSVSSHGGIAWILTTRRCLHGLAEGFGRRWMVVPPEDVEAATAEEAGAFAVDYDALQAD